MTSQTVEQLKSQGNTAFSSGNYSESVEHFTKAISIDSSNHVLYSNRSAAYCALKQYDSALKDAQMAIQLRPDWGKGHGRCGAALMGLGRLEEAKSAYQKGIQLEPENSQLKKGLETVENELGHSEGGSTNIDNPFQDSKLWEKLSSDPKMRPHLEDPNFVKILEDIKRDPKNLTKHIGDQRVMAAFASMLGVNLESRPAEGTKVEDSQQSSKNSTFTEPPLPQKASFAEPSQRTTAEPSQRTTTEPSQRTTTEPSEKSIPTTENSAALKEKELGNDAYKRREFEKALYHYDAALSLDPQNISILTNKAAVYFETDKFDECIALCEEAVSKGRETYADFKLISKALGRIGSAWERKDDLEKAINYYQKSLTEHRTADILGKLKDAERKLELKRKAAYHNPQIAEEERTKGNELFKAGNFVEALKHYTEAIKRDENDPKVWSNRAACYLKLAAIPEGLKDCDKAIQIDPTFVKAYIRRASLLQLKRDYSEALAALEDAITHDTNSLHTQEIRSLQGRLLEEMRRTNSQASEEEVLKRASENPEVRQIMSDPVMQQILKQMQNDPKALMEHMQNPTIAAKIRKLIAAGIIRT